MLVAVCDHLCCFLDVTPCSDACPDDVVFDQHLQIRRAGFSAPTPIQAQAWPVAMAGRDLVAIAKTGSGKTCGFLLPGMLHINATRKVRLLAS